MVNVDIVIPVLNEQEALPVCIARLQNYISENIDQKCNIIIADNGSNDDTPKVSKHLVSEYENIKYKFHGTSTTPLNIPWTESFLNKSARLIICSLVNFLTTMAFNRNCCPLPACLINSLAASLPILPNP